ncbi:DDE_3 domain-containing protein [Trichonephila clavipes]|nr:DDE_3 domain-containing protein [Trichonephila clavipes]
MWNVTDWQKVVFSDESRLFWGQMIIVYGCGGTGGKRYKSTHTVHRHTARPAGVNGQGTIAYDSRSTLTGQRYVDDILRPHVGLFLNGLPGAIFQQDNARPHTVRVCLKTSLRHFLRLFHGHPATPDLSPVEHMWNQPPKRQMPSCHSLHDLELAVQDLWAPSASGHTPGQCR